MPLNSEEVTYLIDRNEKLKSNRQQYESLWEEIAQYIFPGRVGIGYKPTPGAKQTANLFDSSAIFSNDQLAASMCGTITPAATLWFALKLADDRLNHIKPIMDWLELCTRLLDFARHRSNFYAEVPEVYLDLGAFGEGCLLVDEKPIGMMGFNGFYYKALSNSEYCTSENYEGLVDTVFREFELSARVAFKKFGDKVGEKIKSQLNKKPDEKFPFLHAVFPNENGNSKPFVSYYLNLDEKKLISEGGYYDLPYVVPRWRKSSGEDYGRGPGHIALPDVKSLNKAKEFGLKAWAKDLDPPTFERDGGVIGKLKMFPGGRNIVKDKEAIWMLDRRTRYDVSQIKEDALRQSIRQIFYSDQLNLPDKSEMREIEVYVRYELMQRLLGPAVGRFEIELLKPTIEREFGIMMRARALPPPPPILAKMGIREIDIEYENPLAKAQRANEAKSIQTLYSFASIIAQSQPPDVVSSPMDNIDSDAAIRHGAEISGAPSKIIRSVEEVQAIREMRAKKIAAEKQKQDMERLAQGLGDVSPALKVASEIMQGGEGTPGA